MIKWIIPAVTINLLTGLALGPLWMWVSGLFTLALTIGLVLWYNASVRIPEMEIGVVYNTQTQAFLRFLMPGHHWIMPLIERVESTISTAPETLSGKTQGIQAIGGISLTIEWAMAYSLDPLKIPADNKAKMARALPRKTATIGQKHMHNVLQHVIGEYTVAQLVAPGAHKRLERTVRQLIASRLNSLGFVVTRVMIGAIDMPDHVRTALEAVQERQMQTENEAQALARLHQAVSQFSEADMQRLMELERIHRLGQNGVTLIYPAYEAERPRRQATPPIIQPPTLYPT